MLTNLKFISGDVPIPANGKQSGVEIAEIDA